MLWTWPRTTIVLALEICALYFATILSTAARDGAEVGALDVGVHVENRLHVVVVERQRGDVVRLNVGQVAEQLRR